MWVLIDNYDSFTHILHHYLLQLHSNVLIFRNDEVTVDELILLNPERIIISPGPQTPSKAGITNDMIHHFHKTIPILGICLGHQALGVYFGATLCKAVRPMHGTISKITHRETDNGLLTGIPEQFDAMRYHSLVLRDWKNTDIVPLAFTRDDELMIFTHDTFPVTGIQFHPESVLTQHGAWILSNWAKLYQ
jgi:anthranilate synthase/aminodeoxychorismate synthase-like glutamine amidotransferase